MKSLLDMARESESVAALVTEVRNLDSTRLGFCGDYVWRWTGLRERARATVEQAGFFYPSATSELYEMIPPCNHMGSDCGRPPDEYVPPDPADLEELAARGIDRDEWSWALKFRAFADYERESWGRHRHTYSGDGTNSNLFVRGVFGVDPAAQHLHGSTNATDAVIKKHLSIFAVPVQQAIDRKYGIWSGGEPHSDQLIAFALRMSVEEFYASVSAAEAALRERREEFFRDFARAYIRRPRISSGD